MTRQDKNPLVVSLLNGITSRFKCQTFCKLIDFFFNVDKKLNLFFVTLGSKSELFIALVTFPIHV